MADDEARRREFEAKVEAQREKMRAARAKMEADADARSEAPAGHLAWPPPPVQGGSPPGPGAPAPSAPRPPPAAAGPHTAPVAALPTIEAPTIEAPTIDVPAIEVPSFHDGPAPAHPSAAAPSPMSVERYAALSVERATWPDHAADIAARYGVDHAALEPLDRSWRQRLGQDPALQARFQQACTDYRAWLQQQQR